MNKIILDIAPALARSFLAGEFSASAVAERGARMLGRPWRWLGPLADRFVTTYSGETRPRLRQVIQFLLEDRGFNRACVKFALHLTIARRVTEGERMLPAEGAETWHVPAIASARELADWLALDFTELDWFADLNTLGSRSRRTQLSHYNYRVLEKQWGTVRLIEAPKLRLKRLQRQILTGILESVPPHPAVHGFVRRRNIQSFVAPHAGKRVILKMDLCDFFPSVQAPRIQAFFRTAGYPESVADLLGGLCTTAAPAHLWAAMRHDIDASQLAAAHQLYSRRHLPQGAPTSPALANICAYRLDCRLSALATTAGATYTRYADDLAFSGDTVFERRCETFSVHVCAVLLEEGFTPHYRKTRIMRQSVRQQLTGLVVNKRVNVARRDFDRLKAILTNCVRLGSETQNRGHHPAFRSHLEGRVGFVESINPEKGARLRRLFERVAWD